MTDCKTVFADVEKIRAQKPLVLNVTNYVVANTTANALLSVGASPAMTHNPADLEELTVFAGCLVVNIGTPTEEFLKAMFVAGGVAKNQKIPAVLDPVAAGATSVRTDAAFRFLKDCSPAVVRGNASEIMALAGAGGRPKGVDSSQGANEAVDAAKDLAKMFSCVVCVSGEEDYVTDGLETWVVRGGDAMMPYVTGLGCTASAIVGAFMAVNQNALLATVHGMATMSAAGKMAAEKAAGPGTLQLHFYDALYGMTQADMESRVQLEKLS